MTDIVERLRAWPSMIEAGYNVPAAATVMHEAAAEIERLRDLAHEQYAHADDLKARLAEAVEVVRAVELARLSDEPKNWQRLTDLTDAFLAKLEGR